MIFIRSNRVSVTARLKARVIDSKTRVLTFFMTQWLKHENDKLII